MELYPDKQLKDVKLQDTSLQLERSTAVGSAFAAMVQRENAL